MELKDVLFWYDQLRVETIRYLDDYIRSRRGTLAELKDRFHRTLPEEERRRVRTVKKLVDTLEEQGVIGVNNVKPLKMLAEAIELPELKHKVEKFETKCSGTFQRMVNAAERATGFVWQTFKGGVCASAIHLKTVLSKPEVQGALLGAVLHMYWENPEKLKKLLVFVEYGIQLVAINRGSVVFVLKVSSISSLKRLWQSYKDGSLEEKMKKTFNEMKELKEVNHGEEIDVKVTIDEEEYREVLWDLALLKAKGNSVKTDTKRQRRHSVCCGRDFPEKVSKPIDVTQIQIRVGRPLTELEISIRNIKRLKEHLIRGGFMCSSIAEAEEQRLSEIGRQLSEMEIFLAASGFSEIRMKEAEKRSPSEYVTKSIPSVERGLLIPDDTMQEKLLAGSSLSSTLEYYEKASFRFRGRELKLREYQKELAAPALEGKNTIICAPTKSDMTFVTIEIAKRHLDACKILKSNEKKSPKVIFVVDKQNLVLQQRARFEEYLTNYSISDISGSNLDVIPLHRMIQDNDVVVLTAGILMNALVDKSVHITDITLLVFNECHHANKDHPYNQIMKAYLETKLYELETKKLPQVVGLTASLGATTKEQVLQICANLDASNISTVRKNTEELKRFSPQPLLETKKTQAEKKPNIFEKELNKAMEKIEVFIKETSPQVTDRQVEDYRQWIKLLEKKAEENQLACASQLRCYHEALLINSNVRIEDAIFCLDEYFNRLEKSKFTETEYWLQELYLETKERIEKHIKEAGTPENPLLIALQKVIIDFHTTKAPEKYKPKGILFTRTRDCAYALKKWMEESVELKEILRPEVLLEGAALTQSQQEQVIQSFKEGTVNIIIATTVAEEGLDISDCSYVIRYGLQGNEISSVQSKKRKGRSREMLLELVLGDIKDIPSEEFQKLIQSLQIKSVANKKPKVSEETIKKSSLKEADGVTFHCKKCMALVCQAQDIRRFKEAHHVVINKDIYERIDIKPHKKSNTPDGIHFGNRIYCKKCGNDWGVIIKVEETEWPCLKIVSFVTTFNHGKEKKRFKKWKDLPIKICDATLKEMLTEAS